MDKCAVGGRKNEVGLWAGLSKKLFFKFPPPFGVLPLLILDLMIVDFRFPPHKADAFKFTLYLRNESLTPLLFIERVKNSSSEKF